MSEIDQEHVWEMMDGIGICMLVTWDGEAQRARPMASMPRPKEHKVYFLTSANERKDEQIEKFPIVTLVYMDKDKNDYVSLTGHAEVTNDREKISELWSPFVKAWWESPEDPNIRLITVTPDEAEAWDSPHDVVSTIKMMAAAAGLGKPDLGDNAKLDM